MTAEETLATLYFHDLRNLPVLVAENIASYLNGVDLINLGLTCKFWYTISTRNAVWKTVSTRRFGISIVSKKSCQDFKQLYFDLGRSKMPVTDFHYILHLGDRYLKKINDPDSTFGSVIYLDTVCWLQVNGKFCAVLPGRYSFLWRLRMQNPYMNSSGEACIWYKAIPAEGCGMQLLCKWNESKMRAAEKRNGEKWAVYCMGELVVESMCDVHVEIHGRNDYWCGGFYWDYVQLKPIKKNSGKNVKKESNKGVLVRKGSCQIS